MELGTRASVLPTDMRNKTHSLDADQIYFNLSYKILRMQIQEKLDADKKKVEFKKSEDLFKDVKQLKTRDPAQRYTRMFEFLKNELEIEAGFKQKSASWCYFCF